MLFADPPPHPWEIPDLVLCDEAADVDPEKLADLLPRPDVWVTGRKPTAIGEKHAAIGRERRARLEGGPDWEEQDEQIGKTNLRPIRKNVSSHRERGLLPFENARRL